MPAILKFINFDELYKNTHNEKFIINNMDVFNSENKKIIDNYLFSNYESDNISVIPSCLCGNIKGTYYIGEYCTICNTHVKSLIENNVNFILWSKRPEGVEKFISPFLLAILLDRYKFTRPTISLIKYLMLPGYKFDKRQYKHKLSEFEHLVAIFEQNGIKRGYNNFIENLPKIVEILENHFKKKNVIEVDFIDYIYCYKEKYLSDYLPFPNKVIFSTESNELGRFIDKSIIPCINVIRRLSGIDLHFKPNTIKQNKVANSLIELAEFYKNYMKETFFAKKGLIRQHISSTRAHFTMRCVATALGIPHQYNEIHLPWSASVTLFQEHLLNKLIKRGMIYKDAIKFLNEYNRIYHPLLDELFNELVYESNGGISIFINRNPSLHRGSIIHMKVTKIKNDVKDNTISLSLLVARSLNLDLDGDELNIMLILDETVNNKADNFDPHLNILGFEEPNGFTNNIAYPKTIINLISNWYRYDD